MKIYDKAHYPLKSIVFSAITILHSLLNLFSTKSLLRRIIFLVQKNELVLESIEKEFKPTKIITHNVFDIKSFLSRDSYNSTISFNRLISTPFFSICFNEKKMNLKLKLFYETNYYNALKNSGVNMIIMTDEESIPNNSLIILCKNLPITTISLQHGLISKEYIDYLIEEKYFGKYILPDYLIVYGVYEKNIFATHLGETKKNIVPLGSPRHDILTEYKANTNKFREKYNIPKNKKIIFWAVVTHSKVMSKNGENNLNTDIIFSTLKNNNNYFLVIKLHPGEITKESLRYYNAYIKKHSVKNIVILPAYKESVYDCISASDVIIVANSTVGLEAILMNRPVINMATKTELHLESFKELNSCMIVRKESDLREFLTLLEMDTYKKLFKKEREKFIKKHFSNYGTAKNEVIKFIRNLS